MVSKKLMDIVKLFDDDVEELSGKISLLLADYDLTPDEYYVVRHKIMANMREDCRLFEIDHVHE